MHSRFAIDRTSTNLTPVLDTVETAKRRFNAMLTQCAAEGGLTLERYRRYLVFQRHLTRNVQQAFLGVVAHPSLAGRRALREFLFNFALEEEPHSDLAAADLAALAALTPSEIADLGQGGAEAAVMYLRMARWALGQDADHERFARPERREARA